MAYALEPTEAENQGAAKSGSRASLTSTMVLTMKAQLRAEQWTRTPARDAGWGGLVAARAGPLTW